MVGGVFLKLLASTLCVLSQSTLPPGTAGNPIAAAPLPTSQPFTGTLTVPFEYFRQHIYIAVAIHGKPGYMFMLDSGANRNILNLRIARELGMKSAALSRSSDTGFGVGQIYVGPQESVDVNIDSIPIAHAVTLMDLNRFEQHFHHVTDGMLGYPFFRRFIVKVDFQKKLLTLVSPEKFRYRGLGVQRRLKPSTSFVEMPVMVGDNRYARYPLDVVVDTGSNVTLVLYERFIRKLGLESSYLHSQAKKAYGLNGYYPVQSGTIASLQIGDAEIRNASVDYMQDEEQIGPERNIQGAIGNGSLQAFRVVIFDVPHRRMIFEMYPPPYQPGLVRSQTYGP